MMLSPTAIEGLKRFLQHAETLIPSNNPRRENGFAKEFQEIKDLSSKLKKDPEFSTKHGEKEVNRPKNRYKDILPYDYSRVILPESNAIEGYDYVNANYIKGPTNEVVYLTAQGPLPYTVDDFWRMIVSHKIQVIVMACKEYELGKLKCKRYWPESMEEKLELGGCKISLISQEQMGDGFIIRTLSAKSSKEEFKVTQFHYTAWPDHDVPRSATPLIELTMSFRAFVGSDNKVPVLVHCSAGCGRTGTICALDYARSLIQIGRTDNLSVFEIVKNLRRQRIAMVQTKGQYELVYKAVKELVNDELKKHRIGGPTSYYVNVDINTEGENTYENVDFIRSIQRLHQEEKNASRKPIAARETPPSSNMTLVPAPKKDTILAEKTNLLASKKVDNQTNQRKEIPNQLPKETSKENLVQSSTKPLPNPKRPSSGYENVLPLSLSSKPPIAHKPAQNYVNVVIESSKEINDDYVNVTSTKTVPFPCDNKEPGLPKAVPVPDPVVNSSVSYGEQTKHVPLPTKPDVFNKRTFKTDSENESPKLQSQVSTESDYVISPVLSASAIPRPQVNEGQLIDLEEPPLKPLPGGYPAYKPKPVKRCSLEQDAAPNHETSEKQTSKSSRPVAVYKQAKTNIPSGQYSLIGTLQSPESPNKNIANPFVFKEPNAKGRSSVGMIEEVVSDGSSVKLEKPTVCPRRLSEGAIAASPTNSQVGFFGTYSVVQENAVAKEKENPSKSEPTRPDRDKPYLIQPAQQPSHDKYLSNSSRQSAGAMQKAYSTENVNTKISREKPSQKSDFSDYSLVSSPYRPKKSGSSISALYFSADNEGPLKAKPPAALRRSNSGIVASASLLPGDTDGLYATVGVRTKKRPPISADTWTSNGHLPSQDKNLNRSQNSTSSLRSVTSMSSNDSTEDIPEVPVKTTNAFISPDDEDAYETVQRSSVKTSTMDRFRAKARNMITSAPQVPKISLGKKNHSPASTPRSLSPVLGERAAPCTGSHLGYGNRVNKPPGPRSCPGHWPTFS